MSERVALVTGGGSGIGRATAATFAQRGVIVVIADTDEEAACQSAKDIESRGGTARVVIADVAAPSDVERVMREAVSITGVIDYAVNCAGVEAPEARLADCTFDDWSRVIGTNLTGTFLCLKAELRHMAAIGRGSIVNVASVAALVGLRGQGAYAASKHGILGLTRTAALEYARDGVRVNAVCPGPVDTPMLERAAARGAMSPEQLGQCTPLMRLASTDEIAGVIVWLAGDDASYLTGSAIACDGGYLAQ